MTVSELYAALARLHPGDETPADVYVADYADGRRPRWTVAAREDLDASGVRLELRDPDNGDMFDEARLVVVAFPAKVLRTPVQAVARDGAAVVAGKLCDLAQQGRYAARRGGA